MERPVLRERVAKRAIDTDEVRAGRHDRAERAPYPGRQGAGPQILLEETLVDAFERAVRGRAIDQMFPKLRERCARAAQPERFEVLPLADLCPLTVADDTIEQAGEALRLPALERRDVGPAPVAKAFQRADDRGRIRDVRRPAVLHVEHAKPDPPRLAAA